MPVPRDVLEQLLVDAHGAVVDEIPDAADRAIVAGADPETLVYLGAGGEGIVLGDGSGRAFKVSRLSRHTRRFRRGLSSRLRDEAEALAALADTDAAAFVPRFYGYDPELDVITREAVVGTPGHWGSRWGGGDLFELHRFIAETLYEIGFTAPEYKEENYVFTPTGPVLVDLGFTQPIGRRAGLRLLEEAPLWSADDEWGATTLGFAIRQTEQEGGLTPAEAAALRARLVDVYGPDALGG